MKSDILKRIIKEAVKEVIQEELKEILLEALKNNNNFQTTKLNESNLIEKKSTSTSKDQWRNIFQNYHDNVISGIKDNKIDSMDFNTSNIPAVPLSSPPMEGALPSGEVSLNQIMGLMNK